MAETTLYIWKHITHILEPPKKLFSDLIILHWEVRKGFDSKWGFFCMVLCFMNIYANYYWKINIQRFTKEVSYDKREYCSTPTACFCRWCSTRALLAPRRGFCSSCDYFSALFCPFVRVCGDTVNSNPGRCVQR